MTAPPGFAADIKDLFLPFDRDMMLFAFDLWHHADVKQNAAMILDRLAAGDMPCDRPWPAEQVALFRVWVEAGCPA